LLGLLSVIILITAVLECRPALLNAIGRSIVSISLSLLTIHFGRRSDTKQEKLVVILGSIVLILVVLLYIFGIIPCAIL
jgi:membrane protein DedA with SNARE-associated domain